MFQFSKDLIFKDTGQRHLPNFVCNMAGVLKAGKAICCGKVLVQINLTCCRNLVMGSSPRTT